MFIYIEHALRSSRLSDRYDVVVVGSGIVGAATAFHLARLGCSDVLVVDAGEAAGGGTGQSCAIIRSHYSITSNTALAVRSLEAFRDFPAALGDEEADSGFVNSGYLILAPRGRTAEQLSANLAAQRDAGANTFPISADEAHELHPLLDLSDIAAIGYEPESGYADPYRSTTSLLNAAKRLGVTVRHRTPVRDLIVNAGRVEGVVTDDGPIHAGHTVVAIGPWSGQLAKWLGQPLPLEVSRHTVLTLRATDDYPADRPIIKDLTTANKMYFRPSSGGVVLVGTGDHGDPIDDPADLAVPLPDEFVHLQGSQIAHRMPSFDDARLVDSWYGPYDITPDWNPVLGGVPDVDAVTIAYGFSGHGFKLAPAVGEALAETVLGQPTTLDITPYRLSRFEEGALLSGAYGIGSIS
jgi:sarcosine oxidase, subunit beta